MTTSGIDLPYSKRTLANGLDVVVHEDHHVPIVAVNIWYHVGSKDERPGRTGFAHLFEHLMFEGSQHHNSGYFPPLQQAGALDGIGSYGVPVAGTHTRALRDAAGCCTERAATEL